MLTSGTAVGRYVVLDRLGEGAMGEVYRAWDNALDRVVALKLLLPLRAESPAARKRFQREARLTARINHPAVAHVYDVGEFDDSPFLAMEFVPGRQLRTQMGEPMDPARVVFLGRQVLDGLAEAHRQGVVHRDLKPENVLISGRDQVKLVDFGLAKPIFDDNSEATDLSSTGLTGTPRYMAPEQIQGTPIDPRTDIYAFGALLYEMLAGKPAHVGNTLGEMLLAVVHKPVPELPGTVPSPLSALVKRALEKNPNDRFQDADEILSELGKLDLTDEGPRKSSKVGAPPNPRAAVYTQRGREALTGMSSSSSLALDMLQQALELDPQYAPAHAVYAEACAALFNTGQVDASWLDKAQNALETAEKIDPNLPDLRVARARILWTKTFNFPAETALRELRWALKTDPDHVGALRAFATITGHVGLLDHAEAAIRRRYAVDPRDELMKVLEAELYLVDGRAERCRELLAPILRLDPQHEDAMFWWIEGHALVLLGRIAEAQLIIEQSLKRRPDDPLLLSVRALVAAHQGQGALVRDLANRTEKAIRGELHPHHAYHLLACAFSVLGDIPEAIHWLSRTADEGMPCYTWFLRDPLLAKLRADPDGASLMKSLERRSDYFRREFPLNDPATLSLVATEVGDD